MAEDVLLRVSDPIHSTLCSIVLISGLYSGWSMCIISLLQIFMNNVSPVCRSIIINQYWLYHNLLVCVPSVYHWNIVSCKCRWKIIQLKEMGMTIILLINLIIFFALDTGLCLFWKVASKYRITADQEGTLIRLVLCLFMYYVHLIGYRRPEQFSSYHCMRSSER